MPTAKQFVLLAHAAPRIVVRLVRTGLVIVVQLVPFQRSANMTDVKELLELPTAKQLVVLGQETSESPLLKALGGSAMVDHFVPFQCSTTALVADPTPDAPTAKQLVMLEHDTWLRLRLVTGDALAVATGPSVAPNASITTAMTLGSERKRLRHRTNDYPRPNACAHGAAIQTVTRR